MEKAPVVVLVIAVVRGRWRECKVVGNDEGVALGWLVAAPSGRGTRAPLQSAPTREPRHSPRGRVGFICDLLSCRGNKGGFFSEDTARRPRGFHPRGGRSAEIIPGAVAASWVHWQRYVLAAP